MASFTLLSTRPAQKFQEGSILVSEYAPSLLSPSVLSLLPVGAAVPPFPAPPLHPFASFPLPVCELLLLLGELVLQLSAGTAPPSSACNHETSIRRRKRKEKVKSSALAQDTSTAEQLVEGCDAVSFMRTTKHPKGVRLSHLFCFLQVPQVKPCGTI